MRAYRQMTKLLLSNHTDQLRANRHLTQEDMAEQFRISCRAYGDLERGKYGLSSSTLLFLLEMMEKHEIQELLSCYQTHVFYLEQSDVYGSY